MRPVWMWLLAVACTAKTDRVTALELHRAMGERPTDFVVVDVRSDREWTGRGGHIPGAVHHPFPAVKQTAAEIDARPDQTVVLVCFTGHRSQWSMDAVRDAHPGEVLDLKGGMMAWWRRNLPVERE